MISAVKYSSTTISCAASVEQPRWFAVYTHPRHEKAVSDQLEKRGVEAFLPTFTSESQWKDRRVKITQPLFPGYVFARIRMEEKIRVVSSPSVIRIVSFNGMPAAISEREIESVRLCSERGALLEVCPFLEVGERVRVRAGAFEGVEGFVVNRKNGCKLVISIGVIHQSVAIEINAEQLERLSSVGYDNGSIQ